MNKNSVKSILIVGGGLAGVSLAHYLLARKQRVTIIDDGQNVSTRVAAGMVNPIVFRRTTLSWRATELLSHSWSFYKMLENKLNTTLAESFLIKRIFPTENEREEWNKKQATSLYKDHLEAIDAGAKDQNHGIVKSGYFVHAEKFYIENLAYFEKFGLLKRATFDFEQFSPDKANYQGETYDEVVFCCGYKASEATFFENCQVKPTKGQMLIIKHDELPETESIHLKGFVFPIGNQQFRIGATYEWENPSLNPTKEAERILLQNFKYVSKIMPEIVSQVVGVRPTTMDRRPVLGAHPVFSKVHIFNGLGAKGYLLAPKMAEEMTAHLLDGVQLPREYSLTRYATT